MKRVEECLIFTYYDYDTSIFFFEGFFFLSFSEPQVPENHNLNDPLSRIHNKLDGTASRTPR